jgi:nitrogenase subunit NifH
LEVLSATVRGIENELEIVQEFAARVNSRIIGVIPRNEIVQKSEIDAKTVLEKFPDSEQAELYRKLANAIYSNEEFVIPEPMKIDEFDEFFRQYQ